MSTAKFKGRVVKTLSRYEKISGYIDKTSVTMKDGGPSTIAFTQDIYVSSNARRFDEPLAEGMILVFAVVESKTHPGTHRALRADIAKETSVLAAAK